MQKASVWVPTLTQVYNIVAYHQQVLLLLYFSYPLLPISRHHLVYFTSVIISSDISLFDQDEERFISA